MEKNRQKINRMVCAALLVAIEIVLTVTPLGYVQIGPINATTVHLPVILAAMIVGPKMGSLMGFVFGTTSLIRATLTPSIAAFIFTPFVTVGGISGNLWSLVIVYVPRIAIGFIGAYIFRFLIRNQKITYVAGLITSLATSMLHTTLVMSGIWLFFGDEYANILKITHQGLMTAIISVISTNGVVEAVLAAIILPLLVKALFKEVKRMGIYE